MVTSTTRNIALVFSVMSTNHWCDLLVQRKLHMYITVSKAAYVYCVNPVTHFLASNLRASHIGCPRRHRTVHTQGKKISHLIFTFSARQCLHFLNRNSMCVHVFIRWSTTRQQIMMVQFKRALSVQCQWQARWMHSTSLVLKT